jgi:hypothetical protein
MGARHFKQMFNDAFDLDRRALLIAVMMEAETKSEHASKVPHIWKDMPHDRLMYVARELLALGDGFTKKFKLLLLDGEVTVRLMDRHGVMHKIRDTDAIDYDDPIMTTEVFFEALDAYLGGKTSSGEQN